MGFLEIVQQGSPRRPGHKQDSGLEKRSLMHWATACYHKLRDDYFSVCTCCLQGGRDCPKRAGVKSPWGIRPPESMLDEGRHGETGSLGAK